MRLIGDLSLLCFPRFERRVGKPGACFFWTTIAGPALLAGVPPDYFSAQGQLWGNPVYDWEAHARTGYAWWIDRIRALLAHVDVIRLGSLPCIRCRLACAGRMRLPRKPANGCPAQAPSSSALYSVELGGLPFIAEDLGLITPTSPNFGTSSVFPEHVCCSLLSMAMPITSTFPRITRPTRSCTRALTTMRQLANGSKICRSASGDVFGIYLRRPEGEVRDAAPELIGWPGRPRPTLAIAPLQDLAEPGARGPDERAWASRTGNWRWRATRHMLSPGSFEWLEDLTQRTNRAAGSSRRWWQHHEVGWG